MLQMLTQPASYRKRYDCGQPTRSSDYSAMKMVLVLLALALGFAYFYPARHEHAADGCAALADRVTRLTHPAAGGAVHPGTARAMADLATEYARKRFPLIPASASCALVYWGSLLKPQLAAAAFTGWAAHRRQ
jgi:hypothetical protein